jgi:hypothetical protein
MEFIHVYSGYLGLTQKFSDHLFTAKQDSDLR